jgi:hypothetical protein
MSHTHPILLHQSFRDALAVHMASIDMSGREQYTRSLMHLLGLPFQRGTIHSPSIEYQLATPAPVTGHDALIGATLLKLFSITTTQLGEVIADTSSLMAGLDIYQCWEQFLDNEDSAYDLAAIALAVLEDHCPKLGLDAHIAPGLCRTLNAWLKPETPWTTPPSALEAARYMFGDPWCTLRAPDRSHRFMNVEFDNYLGFIALSERPPFVGDIFPNQVLESASQLPGLE